MNDDEKPIPEELRVLNLTPRQLDGVRAYFVMLGACATSQRNFVLWLLLMVASTILYVAIAEPIREEAPFSSLVEVGLQYVTMAGAAVSVLGVLMYEYLIYKARKEVGQALELSPLQLDRVRSLGDSIIRYKLYAWVWFIGAKKEKKG